MGGPALRRLPGCARAQPTPLDETFTYPLCPAANEYVPSDTQPVDPDDMAFWLYSSGTTGLPKGVYYSHRQIVLHAMGLLATFGTSRDRLLGAGGESEVFALDEHRVLRLYRRRHEAPQQTAAVSLALPRHAI